ncbi:MAG: hypothetical protein LBU23_01490 [Planctomycetota bacterium]|jgi:hypothetical protein|nr:hypothetical protein [Planctomycetota bacterium]
MPINAAASQAALLAQISSVSANLKVSGSLLDVRGGTGQAGLQTGRDSADLSATARELANRVKELDVFSIIHPNSDPRRKTKTLDEVESDFLGDFASFANALSALPGLDSGQTLTLGLDGVGGVAVNGGEESGLAGKAASLFNHNGALVGRFAVMAARAALVDAGDTLNGFKDDYASDPFAAIKNNIDALKERLLGFRAQAGGGGVNYGFMRDFELEISYSAAGASLGAASAGEPATPA